MSRWVIYDKSGGVRAVSGGLGTAGNWTLPELEYSGEWMGEAFVTLTVRCAVPVEFEVGDYVLYRGEKFVMNYDPTVVKKARRGTHGEGFVYENVKFNSLGSELSDARMLDYVLYDNEAHYSSLPKFSFFCTDVEDLADRLQVNMNRYCADNGFAVEDYWLFLTPSRDDTVLRAQSYGLSAEEAGRRWAAASFSIVGAKVNQNVSIDKMSVWDSLKFIKDTFGLNFVVRGRSVIVGSAGLPTEDIFEYGKGKGLYEIERTADSEQQIVTKLFSYGSGKNLPVRYYANLNCVASSTVWRVDVKSSTRVCFYTEIPFQKSYFKKRSVSNPGTDTNPYYIVDFKFGNTIIRGLVRETPTFVNCYVECEYGTGGDHLEGNAQNLEAFSNAIEIGAKVYFTSYIDIDKWPAANKEYSGGESALPNNMAVQVLMLPGFPSQSLYDWVITPVVNGGGGGTAVADTHNTNEFARARWTDDEGEVYDAFFSKVALKPFVISPNFIALGIREATKYFDGSDGEDEIFPTIEGIPGKNIVLHSDVIEDNGVFGEDVESIANFNIYLPDFGSDFDLAALLQGDTAIEMKSGYCDGRAFKVHSVERVGSGVNMRWKCNCERELDSDLSIYFPYSRNASIGQTPIADEAYQVRGSDIQGYEGDKYVLTGIEMTSTYVDAASVRLLKYTLRFLSKNDYTRYTFVPKVDEIFMARQHDLAVASRETEQVVKSYYETLKEGDILLFRDTDLGISYETSGSDASVFIDTLRIKEYGNGQIPTYDVTLRDDKQVGTIQRLQEKVSSLSSSLSGGGAGGTNIPQVQSLIKTYGKELFLSKVSDDTASGVISFLKGALFGEGSAWGYVKQVAGEVRSWFKNLATDILTVTGHVKGNSDGDLIIEGNLYVNGDGEFNGSLYAETEIRSGGDIVADNDIIADDGKFSGTITTKNLRVTGSAYFWELIIDKIRAAGGSWLITPADGFEVEKVEVKQGCIRLLWKATDGEKKRRSMWVTGMQAICRTMNAAEGVNYDFSNKYYWSVVVAASTDTGAQMGTIDGVAAHWIEISTELGFYDGSPLDAEVGDEVAQLGFRKSGTLSDDDKAKQSAIYIASYQSIDNGAQAPVIAIYEGIDSFSLANKRVSTISPKEVAFYATKFKIITGNDTQTIADYVDAKILVSAEGILSVVNSLPISRNLLLNTDFNITTSSGNGAMHIVPNIRYQGYRQQSKDANGNWVAKLTKNKHYVLSFYAKGTGKVGAIVNRVNVNSGASTYAVDGVFDLTSYWKRYKVEFDVPNTTVVLGYDVMFGYHDSTGSEVSDIDIMIARPQLEQANSMTEWSGTDAKNILVNSALVDVSGIVPRGWQLWDDGGVPTLREIVPEMVLAYWDEWNDNQMQYDVATNRVTGEKWKSLEIRPTAQYQGVRQNSKVLSGGTWEKVLKHGGTYTLSFFARGTGRSDCIVHLMKVLSDGSAEMIQNTWIGNEFSLSNDWKRFTIVFNALPGSSSDYDADGYAFRVMFGCYHGNPPSNEDIFISRPQLEEGDTATEWHRGEENSEIMSSQIKQTADEISLAVKVDGKKRAGVTLNENGVTIDGDKLHFNGTINDEVTIEGANLHILNDIDLQGLTTENVKVFGRDLNYPIVVNMGVGAGNQNEVVKSVRINAKNTAKEYVYNQNDGVSCPIVVLPFYDSNYNSWKDSLDIQFDEDGSFLLSDMSLQEWQRRVVAWNKSGTRITITNEDDVYARNWQALKSDYSSLTDRTDYQDLLSRCVLICADGRLIAKANINSTNKQWKGNGLATDAKFNGGCFSCGGYAPRFIVVAPGQTLQLRSQIVNIGSNNDVLVWVVENSSEFALMGGIDGGAFPVRLDTRNNPQYEAKWERHYGEVVYNARNSDKAEKESLLAPEVLQGSYYDSVYNYGGIGFYNLYDEF